MSDQLNTHSNICKLETLITSKNDRNKLISGTIFSYKEHAVTMIKEYGCVNK